MDKEITLTDILSSCRQVWNCLIFRPCSVFLPGIYASYVLLGIYLRWDNFDGTMLPSYDDEEMENEDGRI